MKQTMKYAFAKGLFVAALATTFAACSTDDTTDQQPTAGKIKVSLQATMPETRSQITVDEENGRFSGAWDASDAMTVYANSEKAGFTFNADTKVFEGELTDQTTDWTYQAIYPRVGTDGAEHRIPFGAARTQNGSNFNGAYDPLVSEPVTHANSQPGKTPAGEAVTFGLQRLTSIIALTFTTDDAAVSKEKVQSVTLTAGGGEILAAQTFDISLTDRTGVLSTEGQSSSITMSYNAGSEPAAAEFKAYFNVPAGDYGALTATIVTEGHTATVALTDGTTLAAGELAYKTTAVSSWDAAPTMEWVDHEDNYNAETGCYASEPITNPMEVKINLHAPAGIEEFVITVDSKGLAAVFTQMGMQPDGNITTMDLINDPSTTMIKNRIKCPDPLLGHTDPFQLDLSSLVPMILGLPELGIGITDEDILGDHKFTLMMADPTGQSIEKTLIFNVAPSTEPSATISNIDLWKNEATVTLTNAPETAKFQYKRASESQWQDATMDNGSIKIAPQWSNQQNDAALIYYTVDRNTGIFAGETYEWQIINEDSPIASGSFSTDKGNQIPDGDMANGNLTCFTLDNSDAPFWASGSFDAGTFIGKYQLCTQQTFDNHTTAYLAPTTVWGVLAAGSLMTGTFKYASMSGTASFGQSFDYNARPTALKVKLHATIGTVDQEGNSSNPNQLKKGEMDKARVYVCITDWTARHAVTAGMAQVEGGWDPEGQNSVSEGAIIGYGSHWITESTSGTGLEEILIPINYYDKETKPSKKYTIAISCSSSAYGDYKNGSTKSNLYITDFEWVY